MATTVRLEDVRAYPRILYDLAQMPNSSFEEDDEGAVEVSGWTQSVDPAVLWSVTGSQGKVLRIDDQDPNPGKTLAVEVPGGTAAPFIAHGGIPDRDADLANIRADTGEPGPFWYPGAVRVGWLGVMHLAADGNVGDPKVGAQARFQWTEKNADGSQVAGSLVQTRNLHPGDSLWHTSICESTLVGTGVKLHLALNFFNWDREFRFDHWLLGRLLDFDWRRTSTFKPATIARSSVAESPGRTSVVSQGPDYIVLDVEFVGIRGDLRSDVEAFLAYAIGGGEFAFWADRTKNRTEDFHFERCVLDEEPSLKIKAGGDTAFEFAMRLRAPLHSRDGVSGTESPPEGLWS